VPYNYFIHDFLAYAAGFTLLYFCFNAYHNSKNKYQFLMVFVMLDNLALTLVMAIIGYISMRSFIWQGKPIEYYWMFIGIINSWMYCVNMRLYIKNIKLKRWQLVTLKITVVLNSIAYFMLGAYMMYIDYQETGGRD
jgi:hypothetical protein